MRSYGICLPVSVLFHLASYPPGLFMVCKRQKCPSFSGLNNIPLQVWTTCYPFICQQALQFSSVAQPCPILCNPMNCSMPGLPVHLLEFTQTHIHWVSDAIQPSHPLSSPSPPAFNLSQHQGLFKWVNSSHHVAKILEFQLQHQSFQWTPRTDLL